jgi:hypothetical protein
MSEQASRAAEAAGAINERAMRAGTDILQRHAETVQKTLQSGAKIAARMTERSADHFSRAMGFVGTEARDASYHTNGISMPLFNPQRRWQRCRNVF